MKETLESLRHKIIRAGELENVVRTMKALSASNINQYEKAVTSTVVYYRTVELGLLACFSQGRALPPVGAMNRSSGAATGAIVFGSDQGLVGQFNDLLASFAANKLRQLPGPKVVWAVGESICSNLEGAGFSLAGRFEPPHSVHAIIPLVGRLLFEIETALENGAVSAVDLFHNQLRNGAAYEPVHQRFIPFDEVGRKELETMRWPTQQRPEVVYNTEQTLTALLREYFFVSIFRACAESLASENKSRLFAMQRAEKNIKELLNDLSQNYHQLRQRAIDEELFDVIAGSEALHPGDQYR